MNTLEQAIPAKIWQVKLVQKTDPEYQQAFLLAQQVYKQRYQAELHNEPPSYFVYLESETDQPNTQNVKACMSCVPINNGTQLFSERYLDLPIEQYLATQTPREKIIEIGSFSSFGDPFSTWNLMRSGVFIGHLVHKWSYALVTVTPQVASMLKRCLIEFVQIGQATSVNFSLAEKALWGNYYDQNPTVCVIDIHASLLNNIPSMVSSSELALSISGQR